MPENSRVLVIVADKELRTNISDALIENGHDTKVVRGNANTALWYARGLKRSPKYDAVVVVPNFTRENELDTHIGERIIKAAKRSSPSTPVIAFNLHDAIPEADYNLSAFNGVIAIAGIVSTLP